MPAADVELAGVWEDYTQGMSREGPSTGDYPDGLYQISLTRKSQPPYISRWDSEPDVPRPSPVAAQWLEI